MEKPEAILRLEKKLKVKLSLFNKGDLHTWRNRNKYLLNEKNEIILLNVRSNKIIDLTFLNEFTELTSLDLSENQITNISFLKNLKKINYLDLRINYIKDISVLKYLIELRNLNLAFNKITDVTSLKDLKHLEKLNLVNNEIKNITPLFKLKIFLNPKSLEFSGKYVDYPPQQIITLNREKHLEWFDEIQKYDEEPLFEAKLLIVGEPDAGKTSLRKKLIDPTFEIKDGTIQETIGVYVHDGYDFPYYKNKSITISSHIWDFGGQEKQYPLHQYFLKDKSVYALLSLDRGDNQYLDKWFSIIRLLSGNENEIILVLNQKNRTSQSSNFNKEKYIRQGFKFKEHILDLSKDTERFSELQTNIQNALANLPHIGSMFPKYCKTIADEIDKKRFNEAKDYLSYAEYEDLCLELNLKKDDVPRKALSYLSIIGKVVYYEDDITLGNIIIINPHWIIDAIYGILTCEILDEFHQKGRFTKEWLINYLRNPTSNKPNGYKESESMHILNLMLKDHFDICYYVENEFLIPLCMSEILPANDFNESICIQSLFKYEVIPSGMVARMLVRLNEYIEDNLISRTSGILNNGKNRAKIEEYYLPNDANRYIRILVSDIEDIEKGKDIIKNSKIKDNSKKEFLLLIKRELIKIQKDWFENLEVKELIPCICNVCKNSKNPDLFEMQELQKALKIGKDTKECRKSLADINIQKLLGETFELPDVESKNGFYKDETNIVIQVIGDNQQLKDIINMGDKFNVSGDNPNSQFGGKKNTQNNYYNVYQNNDNVIELKEILKELKDVKEINENWQKNFTDAFIEVCKLEDAKEKETEAKSISILQKFFIKAKEIKDWVSIGVLPAEIVTKGSKMLELGQHLFDYLT